MHTTVVVVNIISVLSHFGSVIIVLPSTFSSTLQNNITFHQMGDSKKLLLTRSNRYALGRLVQEVEILKTQSTIYQDTQSSKL